MALCDERAIARIIGDVWLCERDTGRLPGRVMRPDDQQTWCPHDSALGGRTHQASRMRGPWLHVNRVAASSLNVAATQSAMNALTCGR